MDSNKFALFFENAAMLNDSFGIVPLMYGSLGLEYLTGENLCADDIDILIPRVYLTELWPVFKAELDSRGYLLTDEHEHTFERGGTLYAYADIEDLEGFAGICTDDIEVRCPSGTEFMLLSLKQYLAVYRRSCMDGYRVNVRKKKDEEKIRLIESKLV